MTDDTTVNGASFDIEQELVKSNEGAVLYLKDMHGRPAKKADGSPVWIKLAGTNSDLWRQAADTIGNRRLERAHSGAKAGAAAKDMDEYREDQCYMYAQVTLGWDGIYRKGETVACNAVEAEAIYKRAKFIYDQVQQFVDDQTNF
jgi:hypothetical protein